nr:reverse transcriptase domain-containing protein [Tanacetum cinerariifolium]
MMNVIPPDHVDDVPVVEPNQHDDVLVVTEFVLVDEDEDPKEDEFEEEEDPQEEEDDMEFDIKEDGNESELTYPYEEVDPLNPPPPAFESEHEDAIEVENSTEHGDETIPASVYEVGESSTAPFLCEDSDGILHGIMRRDINSLFGRMASLSRRLCSHEKAHALVEKKGKAKYKYYGKLIFDLGNEVCSIVEQEKAAMEKLVEKLGNAEDKMIRRGCVFKERSSEAINVQIEDEKSPSSEIIPPKSTPLTQASIRRMIKENVDANIAAERARQTNVGNDARGSGPVRGQDDAPVIREYTFAGFMKCNPIAFHGTEGVVELLRWFKKTKMCRRHKDEATDDCRVLSNRRSAKNGARIMELKGLGVLVYAGVSGRGLVGVVGVVEKAAEMGEKERYKLSIDRCPNHNMLPVTQIDTFYNGMTLRHRDTINAAAAQWSESSSSITSSSDSEIVALKVEMVKINKNLMRVLHVNQQVKAVTPNCETCGGPHSYNDCPAIIGQTQNVYATGAYQGGNSYQPQGKRCHSQNMLTNMTSLTNSNLELKNMFGKFIKMNTASSLGSGTLPSNTITNPKEDLEGITTRSGTAYQGPVIPTTSSSHPQVVERETEMTKDMVPLTNNGSTKDVQPLVVQIETLIPNSEPVVAPIIEPVVASTRKALIDVYEGELTLHVCKEAITFNLDQTSRYSANYNDMTANRINVIDMACEEYSQEVLGFFDVIASSNPTPYYDPIVSTFFLTPTPFGDNDFLLKEVDAFLAFEDDPTSQKVDHSYLIWRGTFFFLKHFLMMIHHYPTHSGKVELKDLPPHLEYAFLEGDDKLPVIIAKDLSVEEKPLSLKF